ncbi:MAG: cob(I)yrinic acid a,c-diamide adenosyltransferase [Bacteroidetes bacterium]|nr:cob(I)yrinic acid a,c-diamide adenosyltransferase [Bacteroidota bacterium]
MKIYTKTGDKGQTSLIGGTRVMKHHVRIEAYGTIDELNSWIGLLQSTLPSSAINIMPEIQDRLFTIGSLLAADPEKSRMTLPQLEQADILLLENEIDAMNDVLPAMRSFVLPGGSIGVSQVHIARCVCRRAERCITTLMEHAEINNDILVYVNRLSDYLFVLSRRVGQLENAAEIPWKPRV